MGDGTKRWWERKELVRGVGWERIRWKFLPRNVRRGWRNKGVQTTSVLVGDIMELRLQPEFLEQGLDFFLESSGHERGFLVSFNPSSPARASSW